ncbi:MAG: TerC family protein [Rhodocyclaceae bacterium]|nr:TerC family protein [Rhodocyclaceae bacterium]
MEPFLTTAFWISVAQIIAIDILLGGDNAVVIALACRRLPEAQRSRGIFWGVVGAIGLRVVLIFFALHLLELPWLKVVGAALLVWIGVKLMLPEAEGADHGSVEGSATLWGAVRTVVVADAVMSVDNVLAVAGAAHGDMSLVVFGILVSIPIIVWGSRIVLTLMDRFPFIVTLGGALLGWIAGGMLVSDVATRAWAEAHLPSAHMSAGAAGALLVVVFGRWLASRRPRPTGPVREIPLE